MTLMISDTTMDTGIQSSALTFLNFSVPPGLIAQVYERISAADLEWMGTSSVPPSLSGDDYPLLVAIWDNEEDDIFDNL